MRNRYVFSLKALALVAAASLAACSGGSSSSSSTTTIPTAPNNTGKVTANIVGIGDSLTEGFQADGVIGQTGVADPLLAGLGLPASAQVVPPSEESGFWSQFYMQATGATYATMANPATSPLALIANPGLGNMLIPANPALTGGVPFAPIGKITNQTTCQIDTPAYTASTAASVRLNPATQNKDLGVGGMTMHEALTLYNPPVPSCSIPSGIPAQIAGLYQLLDSESFDFYPVVEPYLTSVTPPTTLNIAASLHPTLATVFLGANDVLHFAFSGGQLTAVDNAQEAQADMTTIITTLEKAGADVVVSNVPDVLNSPFFLSIAIPGGAATPNAAACLAPPYAIQPNAFCTLVGLNLPGLTPATIAGALSGIATKYNLGTTGYITFGGLTSELSASTPFNADLDSGVPGQGLGNMYVTPALATSIQAENDAINTGINAAITATGAAKVDLKTVSDDLYNGTFTDPYVAQAFSVNPGHCCTLAYGGGLVSSDGLHFSNTGYALLANAFIDSVNAKYGTTIPDISLASVNKGTGAIPFPDPYAYPQF